MDEFEQAWAEAKEAGFHDGNTLRHYSRSSDAARHLKICEHALGLVGRTNFREDELRDYFLKAVGDDVLCLNKKQHFLVWNQEQWVEDSGSRTPSTRLCRCAIRCSAMTCRLTGTFASTAIASTRPSRRAYVTAREHHLAELGKVLQGKDREHCKRLFLIATNTNRKIENVPYAFFNEYQADSRVRVRVRAEGRALAMRRVHAQGLARREQPLEGVVLRTVAHHAAHRLAGVRARASSS